MGSLRVPRPVPDLPDGRGTHPEVWDVSRNIPEVRDG